MFSMHEKVDREKGCPRCQLFWCAKAFKDESECDIFGKSTMARVARIAKSEKYQLKVDTYGKEKKQETLIYEAPALSTNAHPSDELSDEAYSALVQSHIDDEYDVEAEFSMLKCSMIEDGTYFAKN